MRVVGARCEVAYTGRLTAVLPEATRLLLFKSDGSVLVHADAGGYKPLNSDLTFTAVPRAASRAPSPTTRRSPHALPHALHGRRQG
jgi:RecB family endonuclease NucS